MPRPTLYILVGYPGSGKTTTAKALCAVVGAFHIWSDHERQDMFEKPTHSQAESDALYGHLNRRMEALLAAGKSVVFDTSFNYRRDRDHMRQIADRQGADVVVLQMNTPKQLAKDRATHHDHALHNKYDVTMTDNDFERITGHLEQPADDEHAVVLDGTKITPDYVRKKLGLTM